MIVDWTKTALSDLNGIHDQIVGDSTHYASVVVERLTGRCSQIAESTPGIAQLQKPEKPKYSDLYDSNKFGAY